MTESEPLLEVENLEKYFEQTGGILDRLRRNVDHVQAVDGVSMTLRENESQAVIGESGCGKTTLIKTLMGLQEHTGGTIRFRGTEFSSFTKADWREFRRNVQIIFQDPFNSLDPKFTVRETVREPLEIHDFDDKEERVKQMLREVQLNPPERYLDQLPDQLSGGEKQRVSIARALVVEPDIVMADEPVSMLDVSTQASILQLLNELIDEMGVSMVYISHDLSTVSYVSDYVNVMYLGRIVERAPTLRLIEEPKHPYTEALVRAIPRPDPYFERGRVELEGSPGDPINIGPGCRFRDRCPERMDVCEKTPRFLEVEDEHETACHLYYDHEEGTPAPDTPDAPTQAATDVD